MRVRGERSQMRVSRISAEAVCEIQREQSDDYWRVGERGPAGCGEVSDVPTYIVIDPDGTVASAVEGDQGFGELRKLLKKAGLEVD